MSYEKAPVRGVNAQYGARHAGGEKASPKTEGGFKEYTYNFDAESADNLILPAGVIVWNVIGSSATGAIATATVGGTDVSTADGTEVTAVLVPAGGELILTGPTAGTVVVKTLEV